MCCEADTIRANIPINPISAHKAVQADGVTPLDVVGEVHCNLSVGKINIVLNGVVVKKLQCPILGGTNFIAENEIVPIKLPLLKVRTI